MTKSYPHFAAARLREEILCLWQHSIELLASDDHDRRKNSCGRNYNLSTQIDRYGIADNTLPAREYHESVHDLDRRRIITDRGHDTADLTKTT